MKPHRVQPCFLLILTLALCGCGAENPTAVYAEPAGKRNEVSSLENGIVLLYEFTCGPEGGGRSPAKKAI